MFRALFTIVLPLILPTVIYLLYMRLTRPAPASSDPIPGGEGDQQMQASAPTDGAATPPTRPAPWILLGALGVLLAGATAIALSLFDGYDKGMVYVPAHLDAEGRLVPARTVPADQAPPKRAP